MKKILTFLLLLPLMVCSTLSAQILDPIKWKTEVQPVRTGVYKLVFTASIDDKWHSYSQHIVGEGPIPTSLTFDTDNKNYKLLGKTIESGSKVHHGHDPVFDIDLKTFENDMTLVQKVKILKDTKVKVLLTCMVCDEGKCVGPIDKEYEFDLTVSGKPAPAPSIDTVKPAVITNPDKQKFDNVIQSVIQAEVEKDSAKQPTAVVADGDNKFGKPLSDCGTAPIVEDQSVWMILALGFFWGLVALITPCVFPMIPLTVSFFTKRGENQTKGKLEALFYAVCIIGIYFLLSLPFAMGAASDSLNELSTGAPLNVFFFVIFVIFAFSFFGFYEIQLPSFIANKADSASNIGGLLGIFFMALTLAIVSFSCTGPILGSLLVGAVTTANGKINVIVGMTAFGTGLALPFGLFAFFPSMMKSLPKSGGWLDTVKKVLGFVELIFAFKFLSTADMVAHWGILPREIFLVIWAVLGGLLFLFLIGRFKLPHTTPVQKFSFVRVSTAILALAFTVYSVFGVPGNKLSLFSGFLPPTFYSIFNPNRTDQVKVAEKVDNTGPVNLEPIRNDYEKALALARKEGKPLMIDFTGWGCANCRRVEENVWTDSLVKQRLTKEFVVLSLYVDDKKELPLSEQYVSTVKSQEGKKIRTIGNKFSEMQAKYFYSNSQPLYVLITPDEKLLTKPQAYTLDVKEYAAFLDCGLNTYKTVSNRSSLLGK